MAFSRLILEKSVRYFFPREAGAAARQLFVEVLVKRSRFPPYSKTDRNGRFLYVTGECVADYSLQG